MRRMACRFCGVAGGFLIAAWVGLGLTSHYEQSAGWLPWSLFAAAGLFLALSSALSEDQP